jgi:2'-5' RNA ligase
LRLFVALDLPGALALPEPPDPWRPTRLQHVTLVFLGERAEVPVFEDAPPAAVLEVDEPILLPPRRPRVLAVRLRDPSGALTAYQARLAEALGVIEDRPWLPHVTIGRTRERVSRAAPLPEVDPAAFTCPSATLYRSAGGRYEALVRLPAQN